MNKYFKYLSFFISVICLSSCDNLLDTNTNILSDDQVFSNESAIEAYMVTLYNNLPMEDFSYRYSSKVPTDFCGLECLICEQDNPTSIGDGTWWNKWSYSSIRNVNYFLSKIPNATLTDTKISQLEGEAKFIRAYCYFGLVKRYGGVPIIKTVQNYDGSNIDELQVARDTEKDVYDFIASDLDEAISLLPEESTERGRANKYVALALKSRVMLYAASIAKYGSVQLDGIVGIPASNTDTYWKASFDAAKEVLESGKYSLYNTDPTDPASNFQAMFLDNSTSNTEAIFSKDFYYPDKTHSYDLWNIPYAVRCSSGYGSRINPTLEFCEDFEYIDGSDGALKIKDENGNYIKYKNAPDIFNNKDPRFTATVIVPFSDWRGTTIDVQKGIIDNGDTITTGNYKTLYDTINHVTSSSTGIHIIGENGIGGGTEVSITGFYIRKYLNTAYDASDIANGSYQSFIDIRLGEILLNYAEAAAELGDISSAKYAVNLIRSRAGIALLNDNEVTIDKIRHERKIELSFESHWYWDIRRWRIADNLINNEKGSAILPYYDIQSHSYIFKRTKVGYSLTFYTKLYYEKISDSDISANPKLVQNPNY
jgi:starch-binding outer membrane protein, SusD/RagB family